MRGIRTISRALAIAGALFFVALNLAGAVWAGTAAGGYLSLPDVWNLWGQDFGITLFVILGIAAFSMKLVAGFAAPNLWRCGQYSMTLIALMTGVSGLLYGWSAGVVSLLVQPELSQIGRTGLAITAVAWLFVEMMSVLSLLVAIALMSIYPEEQRAENSRLKVPVARDEWPSGSVKRFVKERTAKCNGSIVRAKTLFEAYCVWCRDNALQPIAYTQFGKSLTALGLDKGKSGGNIVYKQIALSDTPSRDDAGRLSASLPAGINHVAKEAYAWRKVA